MAQIAEEAYILPCSNVLDRSHLLSNNMTPRVTLFIQYRCNCSLAPKILLIKLFLIL